MMKQVSALFVVLLLVLGSVPSLQAVEPDEVLSNPKLEERARLLSKEFRCLVCQNQSIDDSDASLAKDLRVLIRDRLSKGDSDQQVIDFVVGRYGEFVLLKPAFKPHTYILWFGPFLILIAGIFGVVLLIKRQKSAQKAPATKPLSASEKAKLKKILK